MTIFYEAMNKFDYSNNYSISKYSLKYYFRKEV